MGEVWEGGRWRTVASSHVSPARKVCESEPNQKESADWFEEGMMSEESGHTSCPGGQLRWRSIKVVAVLQKVPLSLPFRQRSRSRSRSQGREVAERLDLIVRRITGQNAFSIVARLFARDGGRV